MNRLQPSGPAWKETEKGERREGEGERDKKAKVREKGQGKRRGVRMGKADHERRKLCDDSKKLFKV